MMSVFCGLLNELKLAHAATSPDQIEAGKIEQPYENMVKDGVVDCFYWMDKAAKEAIVRVAMMDDPNDFGPLHGFEYDQNGRMYAEMSVRCYNTWGVKVPRNFAIVFYGISNDSPCKIQKPGPRMLRYMPGFRKVVRDTLQFAQPGDVVAPLKLD